MYSLTVSDHVMVAHSLRGEVFGPAQQLHGATFVVEAEFRRPSLDESGLVVDIGLAGDALRSILARFEYRNLDELPDFAGSNTTTEFMAGFIFNAIREKIVAGGLGRGTAEALASLKVTVRETPRAWASFEGEIR